MLSRSDRRLFSEWVSGTLAASPSVQVWAGGGEGRMQVLEGVRGVVETSAGSQRHLQVHFWRSALRAVCLIVTRADPDPGMRRTISRLSAMFKHLTLTRVQHHVTPNTSTMLVSD